MNKWFQNLSKTKIIAAIAACCVLLSVYLALSMNLLFKGYYLRQERAGHFVDRIRCVQLYGFPWVVLIFFLFVFAVIGFFIWLGFFNGKGRMDKLGRKFRMARNNEDAGGAHFEEPEEYADIINLTPIDDATGTIIGVYPDHKDLVLEWKTKGNRKNSHIVVFGASGTGKSYIFSINYAYQAIKRGESLVITDPDGGLQRELRGIAMKMGYTVRCLNLVDFSQSDGWDCMKALASGNIDETSQMFANTVISNVMDVNASQPIYSQGPMSLLRALILRTWLDPDLPADQKNIKTAYNHLMKPNCETYLDNLFDETTLTAELKPCLMPWRSFLLTSANLKGNLIANLAIMLQLLQGETLSTLLSTDDMDLELPGKQKCVYFCQFPDNSSTYSFVVSLFFSMIVQTLVNYADSQPDGKLKVPVNFLMDEFPSIGVLPDWDRKMATIRKRQMNVVMIIQDITQLQHNYDETWLTIFANCATWIAVGINDPETAKLISERIGETTIETMQEQKQISNKFIDFHLHPFRTNNVERSLLSQSELFTLDQDALLVLVQSHNPIMAEKFPHINHPSYQMACDDPLGRLPPLTDVEARQERKVAEEEYRQQRLVIVEQERKQREAEKAKEKAVTPETSLEQIKGKVTAAKGKFTDWFFDEKPEGKATAKKKPAPPKKQVKTQEDNENEIIFDDDIEISELPTEEPTEESLEDPVESDKEDKPTEGMFEALSLGDDGTFNDADLFGDDGSLEEDEPEYEPEPTTEDPDEPICIGQGTLVDF